MSIKLVDLNEEATEIKDEPPTIEEATEQAPKEEPTNEIIDEPTEEAKQEPPKEEVKTITKKKASDIVECNKCNKSMTYKNLRYSHNCSTEPKPVKKQDQKQNKNQHLNHSQNQLIMKAVKKNNNNNLNKNQLGKHNQFNPLIIQQH